MGGGETPGNLSFFFAGPWGRTRGTALCPSPLRGTWSSQSQTLALSGWTEEWEGRMLATTFLVRNSAARRKLFSFCEEGN